MNHKNEPACPASFLATTLLTASATLLAAGPALADNVFQLGSVVVKGAESAALEDEQVMSSTQIERYDLNTVGEAVRVLPGVSVSRNSRNEEMVYLRGFDPRQVPVFLDGIPLYVPYDGYVDYGRFTTFDLSQIRVAKGAASLLYGPNIMGGAINLVTRKPSKEFEGDVRIGYASGAERKAALNVGTNQGLWYLQAGASWLEANSFPLGRGFQDYRRPVPTDTGNYRENAYRTDKKFSVKLGLTPNATDEYAIGYVNQQGEKGNPAYTGELSNSRFWQWPYWDKESLYFISNTDIGQDHTVKFRIYHDKYKNRLDFFTDGTYTTPHARNLPSLYDDQTYGASMELISRAIPNHELHLALHYKDDRHHESEVGSTAPTEKYRDVTKAVAVEDLIDLSDSWRLRIGGSYEQREAREVFFWPTGKTDATNGLAEIMYDLTPDSQVFASLAYKTRFPTIKDRYSARFGSAQPNPDLQPEKAQHMEVGYRGAPWSGGHLEVALFQSNIRNLIQNAVLPLSEAQCGDFLDELCNQAQNIGKARHRGLEVSLQQEISRQWRAGLAYTYLNRKNQSDASVRLTDTPSHRLFAHVSWKPNAQWEVLSTLEAESGRYVSYSNAEPYKRLSGFGIWGLKGIWTPRSDLSLEAGVRNITDRSYELADGYPMPGRVWYATAIYRF
ncbi:TonB-dependent receptor plug domain-containing protein [Pusillimonas sp.]|uniref:TonB-dependent receptor plug domain-containing protein n=1 Tax=Pusillimonas sp. TaxID=3040095 RepID=UPI0037CCB849